MSWSGPGNPAYCHMFCIMLCWLKQWCRIFLLTLLTGFVCLLRAYFWQRCSDFAIACYALEAVTFLQRMRLASMIYQCIDCCVNFIKVYILMHELNQVWVCWAEKSAKVSMHKVHLGVFQFSTKLYVACSGLINTLGSLACCFHGYCLLALTSLSRSSTLSIPNAFSRTLYIEKLCKAKQGRL